MSRCLVWGATLLALAGCDSGTLTGSPGGHDLRPLEASPSDGSQRDALTRDAVPVDKGGNPDAAAPKLDAAASKFDLAAPKPDAAAPKPDAAAPKPDQGQSDSSPKDSGAAPASKLIIFSPSPRQADHSTRYDLDFHASWVGIGGGYDMLNLHAADIWTRSDAFLTKVKARLGTKPLVLEMQSTAGLLHFGLQSTGSCNPALDLSHAKACGTMAADAWYNGGSGGLGLYRLKQKGLNVRYLMLDSAFYAPYFHVGYVKQGGVLHTALGKSKAMAFMDGFISRMRATDKFGAGLKFIMISHFKYEYVAGKPGFRNRTNGKTCFNTCATGSKWIDEDVMVNTVLAQLPGRFEMVLFDASWSSFYVTPGGWARWDKMINAVDTHKVKVGNIIMSDADLAQDCGHDECWFSSDTTCTPGDEKLWWVHNMSYVDTLLNGNGLIANYPKIDAMMIASWHRMPRSTFQHKNVCAIPMEDVLRCAASSVGRTQLGCPKH